MNACPLGLAVKSSGSLSGIGKVLRAVGEEGPGDPDPLAERDPDPGLQAGADQRECIDQLGMGRGSDHRQLAPPTDPRQAQRRRGLLRRGRP